MSWDENLRSSTTHPQNFQIKLSNYFSTKERKGGAFPENWEIRALRLDVRGSKTKDWKIKGEKGCI